MERELFYSVHVHVALREKRDIQFQNSLKILTSGYDFWLLTISTFYFSLRIKMPWW